MNGMERMFGAVESAANEHNAERKGDYRKDGLLICGRCHTPKQTRVSFLGDERIVGCLCKCGKEARDAELLRMKKEEEALRIQSLRANCIQDRSVRECRFEVAEDNKMIRMAKRYVDKWETMYEDNIGLMFWGNTGNGKTFTAACIANALIDKGVPVLVTDFARIIAAVTGMKSEEKIKYLDSLSEFKLLVIDDLGAERQSEYALEQVYSVIDQRYKAKKPIIITTNIEMEELKNPKNIDYQRIYDRALEMCVPVQFKGDSMRKRAAADKLEHARELLKG